MLFHVIRPGIHMLSAALCPGETTDALGALVKHKNMYIRYPPNTTCGEKSEVTNKRSLVAGYEVHDCNQLRHALTLHDRISNQSIQPFLAPKWLKMSIV